MISPASKFADSLILHQDYLLAIAPSVPLFLLSFGCATTFSAAEAGVGPPASTHSLYTMANVQDQLLRV